MTTRTNILTFLLAALLAFVSTAGRAQGSGSESLLLPISVYNVPGGYGTVWSTELWCRNNSAQPVWFGQLPIFDYALSPGLTEQLHAGNFPPTAPSQFIFVMRGIADSLQFDLRLFNSADRRGKWGTKLPVVHEREFARTINLINVPAATDFRSTLRVYGTADIRQADDIADVRVHSLNDRLLAQTTLSVDRGTRYAAIASLTDAFPAIRSFERVRVEVTARDEQTKLWAFISVTSNTTQDVSLVTP